MLMRHVGSCRSWPLRLDGPKPTRCGLRPNDELWALYRSYYPRLTGRRRWIGSFVPDELEMETLAKDLRAIAAGSRRIDLHPAVTIGELVKRLGR
jgi:hypothetical protein